MLIIRQKAEVHDLISSAMAIAITALGGVFFAWINAEWKYNLWSAIGLQVFMILWWILFAISPGATGGILINAFRGVTILLAIFGTIWHKKHNNIPYEVTLKT